MPLSVASKCLEYSENQRYCNIFNYVGSADETFFQTTIMNYMPEERNNVTVNDERETSQRTLTYTDFYGGSDVSLGHPIILRLGDIDRFIDTDFLFARKFDMSIDHDVFNVIEKTLIEMEIGE